MSDRQTALALAKAIQSGEQSAQAVTEAALERIRQLDPSVQAFLSVTESLALETAAQVDQKVARGEKLPLLSGVPIAIKDNIHIQGVQTTCASKILEGFVAPYTATVIRKIQHHMMPMVGKTNMDEFAMGSSTENSAYQKTRNPWDLEHVPGGSSGGSAAAVSAGMVPLALGSDTGGSVRQPASLCGLVGIKPTYGLVSRYGLVAFASSLDQISPFGVNVADTAALLQIIAGFDAADSTSLQCGDVPDYLEALKHVDLRGKRLGFIQELLGDGLQPEVKTAIESAIHVYQTLGAEVVPISLPHVKYAIAAYYIIATAEASSNLARYDGVRYGFRDKTAKDILAMYRKSRATAFGKEVTRRIMLGTFSLSSGYYDAYYGKAQKVRELIRQDFAKAFSQVEALICPTAPTTAFKIGEKSNDPVSMYLSDIATIPINLAGIPAISLPCGFDQQGLPIGMQLLGPHLSETSLFQIAQAYETASGFSNLQPPLEKALV